VVRSGDFRDNYDVLEMIMTKMGYAIFDVYEVFILTGSRVTKPRGTRETITKEDILRKYGVQLE